MSRATRGANGTQTVADGGAVRAVGCAVAGIVVFAIAALVLMVVGAFSLRTVLGVARYRDLGLPVVVIGGALLGGAGLGIGSFRRLCVR